MESTSTIIDRELLRRGTTREEMETLLHKQGGKCLACSDHIGMMYSRIFHRASTEGEKELLCNDCGDYLDKLGPSLRKIKRYLSRRYMVPTWSKVAKLLRYV